MKPKPHGINKKSYKEKSYYMPIGTINFFPNLLFFLATSIIFPLVLEAQPFIKNSVSIQRHSVHLKDQDSILFGKINSEFVQNTQNLWVISDGIENTIFVGGAGFRGKFNEERADSFFTHNLIMRHLNIFDGHEGYHTSRKSKKFLGFLFNSTWSIKFGRDSIKNFKRRKHRALRRTCLEIIDEYKAARESHPDQTIPLNLVGSSYGSVVIGQLALRLLRDKDNGIDKINTLTLSASPISPNSKLGNRLIELVLKDKIDLLIWHPNSKDNVTGAKSIWKLICPGDSAEFSILSRHHPHNVARKNTNRTKTIIQLTLIDKVSEGPVIQAAAQAELDSIPEEN